MSGIIESIEKAQLKEHVDQFNVGDTVRVYAKIREGEKERKIGRASCRERV